MNFAHEAFLPHKVEFNLIARTNLQAFELAYAFAVYQGLNDKVNNMANAPKPLLFGH